MAIIKTGASVEEMIEMMRSSGADISSDKGNWTFNYNYQVDTYENDKFSCYYDSTYKEIVIIDKVNNTTITYNDNDGYSSSDWNGKTYHIAKDGTTTLYYENGECTFKPDKRITLEDLTGETTIIGEDGNNYTISNGRLKSRDYYENGIKYENIYDTYGGLTSKIEYNADGSIFQEEYYNADGTKYIKLWNGDIHYLDKNNSIYRIDSADGTIMFGDYNYLYPDGTYSFSRTGETGTYYIDEDGQVICTDADGDIKLYDAKRYELIKKIKKDGTIYTYDLERETQREDYKGQVSYTRMNHIEYDKETYNNIIRSLNSVASSYKGKFANECSNIEGLVKSFPDQYSVDINSTGNSIEEHINLISSLVEMTNYSLLAYQTCDDGLKEGLYLLVDSLFDENEKYIAGLFKTTVANAIEDRDNDGILEYKENTDFKTLAENVIVASKYVDDDNNIWYLNKNNKVLDVDGSNITISYGGETFNLSKKNGVLILKDSNGNDINIFGDYNIDSKQYGGNQGKIRDGLDNSLIKAVLDRYVSGVSLEEKVDILNKAACSACGKIAITNLVFKKFQGHEEEFQKTFGYPMYDIKKTSNGFTIDYNYEPLALELCFADKDFHYEGDGVYTYDKWYTNLNDNVNFGTVGTDIMEEYLQKEYNVTLDNLEGTFNYRGEKGYTLYNPDGSIYLENGDAHAMIEVGRTEDGKIIVSSWGKKFILETSSNPNDIEHGKSRFKEYN